MSSSFRSTLRDARRAPVRVAASILAIALAIAAIGVFAVPGVSNSALREIAAEDQLTHLYVTTSEMSPADLAGIDVEVPGLVALETRTSGTLTTVEHGNVHVVGRPDASTIDRLRVTEGRLPTTDGEIAVTPGLGVPGELLTPTGAPDAAPLEIVGVAETTWFGGTDTVFTLPETAEALLGVEGTNRIVARLVEPNESNLESAVAGIRAAVWDAGATLTSFPEVLVDGAHPIEEDIEMISFMIGGLGVVAGIVALILLSSTANSIVTERTRVAAILRAVGATRREVRRELRRPAIAIGVAGTVLGLPLGLVVANVISRMVLNRFAGITPDVGIDIVVLAASAAFGIVGARAVSGRTARKVAKAELASALRDRDALPFGNRWSNRLLARIPTGDLLRRMAVRAAARRRGRAIALSAQFAGAVAAVVLVTGLATSVFAFNDAELASFDWETSVTAADPGYPFALDGPPTSRVDDEVGIHVSGEVDDWYIELFGVDPATTMFDKDVNAGSWLAADQGTRGLVLAEAFAEQEGHAIGDTLTVELASGTADYEIVGLHPIRSVAAFVPVQTLADDLGTEGNGNTIWSQSHGVEAAAGSGAVEIATRDQLFAEDTAARDAIVAIFGAIGLIVVAISAIGISSTHAMGQYERRGETATVQAVGAGRRDLRELIRKELAGLALVGWVVGVAGGVLGARAIMNAFATANAIDLGFAMPWVAVPVTAVAVAGFVQLLTMASAGRAARIPAAVTLRAAT